ncbi:hypothetical protein M0805_008171 [Coniferiporia weirii]|nr:hypothetical protein M0805_008171 [Coniferiporia weirii]
MGAGVELTKKERSERNGIEISQNAIKAILSAEARAERAERCIVDDTECRLNALFDALNCETLSPPVVSQLGDLTEAMAARDRQHSLAIHAELLVQGSRTDDIGLCMSAIKLLIMRP